MTYPAASIDAEPPVLSDCKRVVLVSSDDRLRTRLRLLLATRGCRVDEFSHPQEAICRLRHLAPDVILLDAEGPECASWERGCIEILAERIHRPTTAPVVLVAPEQNPALLARLMGQGAADSIKRTCSDSDVVVRIASAIRDHGAGFLPRGMSDRGAEGFIPNPVARTPPARSQPPAIPTTALAGMVMGRSDAMRHVLECVHLVADKQTTVLISGETGTGKERIARALHAAGKRSAREMVSVNCAGIPSNLLEDEFFGHVKGAFTDAHQNRAGRFEQAGGSSIFLDEIGELPLNMQPKLLRVLQERELHRIGGLDTIRVDARVIAATNVDLWTSVQEGGFREDLFYRLNVFPIHLPALRERREDIPVFLNHFLEQFRRREGLRPKRIQPAVEAELMARAWPGNIRELENAVEMAVILSGDREMLSARDFPKPRRGNLVNGTDPHSPHPDGDRDYKTIVQQFERGLITRVLEQTNGNKTLAAERLQLNRTTLIEKWKKLQQGSRNYTQAAAL